MSGFTGGSLYCTLDLLPFQGARTRQPSFQWSGSKASLNLMCKTRLIYKQTTVCSVTLVFPSSVLCVCVCVCDE